MVRARKPKGDPPQMFGDEDPRAPYKVYEGDELKGTYATRAEGVGGNSNSKASTRTVISSSRTETATSLCDWLA